MGNMKKEWVVFNKLEDFNSLLKYTGDDFTPTGKLCYINENGEMLPVEKLQFSLSLLDLLLSGDPQLFLAFLVSCPKDCLFTCIFHSL